MSSSIVPFEQTLTISKILAQSGFFADSREAAQAVVKVLAGQELGFGPIASMTGVYIVKGKVALSANLMAAAIKRSGRYNYRVRAHDDTKCEIVFFENGEQIGVSIFTTEDAKRANLTDGNWRTYPRNMLFARALSNGVKWFCPDLSGGPLYTPDELGERIDGESGEVITSEKADDAAEEPGRIVDVQTGEVRNMRKPISEAQMKAVFAIGRKLYGDGWDNKRPELIRAISKGRVEHTDEMFSDEASRMIEGMKNRLDAQDQELVAAAAANPQSIHASA